MPYRSEPTVAAGHCSDAWLQHGRQQSRPPTGTSSANTWLAGRPPVSIAFRPSVQIGLLGSVAAGESAISRSLSPGATAAKLGGVRRNVLDISDARQPQASPRQQRVMCNPLPYKAPPLTAITLPCGPGSSMAMAAAVLARADGAA